MVLQSGQLLAAFPLCGWGEKWCLHQPQNGRLLEGPPPEVHFEPLLVYTEDLSSLWLCRPKHLITHTGDCLVRLGSPGMSFEITV